MTEWLTDDNGNKCSVEYWRTKEGGEIPERYLVK